MGVDSLSVGNFAAPHAITHEGRRYEISLIDQRAKAEWERRLFQRAVDAADVLASAKPAGWKDARLDELSNQFMAGEFALLNEASLNILKTPGGVQLLLSILTGLDIVDLAPVIVAKKKEVEALLHLIIRESFPGLKISPNQAAEVEADAPN